MLPELANEAHTYLFLGAGQSSLPLLPTDPTLIRSTPTLPSLGDLGSWFKLPSDSPKTSSSVIAEGIPPISTKLLERIQKWEFVDLASLLAGDQAPDEVVAMAPSGQLLLVSSSDRPQQRKKKCISDIHSWVQAFTIYAAALSAAESTTREETVGLFAHMSTILQLARDLGGNQWIQYDKVYREWAAAKEIKVWGELNLSIFGHCLASQYRAPLLPPAEKQFRPAEGKKRATPYSRSQGCRLWNFEGRCTRPQCRFLHSCYFCGGNHRGDKCPSSSGQSANGSRR